MPLSLFRSRRAAGAPRAGSVSPQALAKARRLATPYVRALAAADRLISEAEASEAAEAGLPATPHGLGRVFQVLSPDRAGLAAAAAAQMAFASRVVLGRRTLMLEHQAADSRNARCERVAQPRLPDLPWHPRLRLPNDRPPAVLDAVLQRARRVYSVTLIAGRDIHGDPETLKCAGLADGVILLVSADQTRAPEAREALKAVVDAGGTPVGFLMTGRQERVPSWAGGARRSAEPARAEA